MIDKNHYLELAKKYGHFASWAIWADGDNTPKSNVGNLSIFDLEINKDVTEQLNPNVIMVGLNISRKIEYKFGNFHDRRPQSQDYKIRYAFKGSKFYGAYMTDIIKDFKQVISGNVISYLKSNPDFERHNIDLFEQELLDIKSINPIIIAFGNHSFTILDRHFKHKYQILKIPHYSSYISKEEYKNEVDKLINKIQCTKYTI
jgi:hypothetical protein